MDWKDSLLLSINSALRVPITISSGAIPGALSRYYLTVLSVQWFGAAVKARKTSIVLPSLKTALTYTTAQFNQLHHDSKVVATDELLRFSTFFTQ